MIGQDHFITKVFDEALRNHVHKLWQFDTRTTELKKLYAAYLQAAARK